VRRDLDTPPKKVRAFRAAAPKNFTVREGQGAVLTVAERVRAPGGGLDQHLHSHGDGILEVVRVLLICGEVGAMGKVNGVAGALRIYRGCARGGSPEADGRGGGDRDP
jgi:hypothetical protein